MDAGRDAILSWVVREILPHEPAVRAWLRRSGLSAEDAEDVMQEAYCRFSGLADVSSIQNARGYFFQSVRGLLIDQWRRAKVVPIDTASDLKLLEIESALPGPDRAAYAKRQLAHVQHLIADLPARCRTIFLLRKIEGLPQRAIAERLGISETIVENDVRRALRMLSAAFGADGAPAPAKDAARG